MLLIIKRQRLAFLFFYKFFLPTTTFYLEFREQDSSTTF